MNAPMVEKKLFSFWARIIPNARRMASKMDTAR
jgi:hypothetical protein